MFEWKIEEYKFKEMRDKEIEDFVETLPYEEQLEIVKTYSDVNVEAMLSLAEVFKADDKAGLIKHQKSGFGEHSYNYQSVKAWRKKHGLSIPYCGDAYDLVRMDGYVPYVSMSPCCHFYDDETELKEKYVKGLCCLCFRKFSIKERDHFCTHDEWQLEYKKYSDRNKIRQMSMWSSGNLDLADGTRRKITVEELKALNAFYDKLDVELEDFLKDKFSNFPVIPNLENPLPM